LAGKSKGSKEEQRSWIVSERSGGQTPWLNLSRIVDTAFSEDDWFRSGYAQASAAMHGRYVRSSDLLILAAPLVTQARRLGLMVLERLFTTDSEISHLAAAFVQCMRLEHAASFGGTSESGTDKMTQQTFGIISGKLLRGIEYSGEGTVDSPFVLKVHLPFHQTSYAMLEQLGVNPKTCRRVLIQDATGSDCDCWFAPDREYWFRVPLTVV
jgi:hypothetical protein